MKRMKGSARCGFGAAFIAALMALSVGRPAISAESPPFKDADANGYVGFCDKNKRQVSSGSIYDQPFIWTAVSSAPAPEGYKKGKAVLIAFQPREGVEPGLWSGRQLTASSTFTNPAHPMSQATNADDPLLFFTQGFPPKWDGLVQLRMYFSARDMGLHKIPYPATIIRVTGDRWSVVSGGKVDCKAGTATSIESETLPKALLASPAPLTVAGAKVAPDTQATSKAGIESLASGGSRGGLSGGDVVRVGFLGVALLGGGVGGFYRWRRRRSAVDA